MTKDRAGTTQAGGMNDVLVAARCASQRRSSWGKSEMIGPITCFRVKKSPNVSGRPHSTCDGTCWHLLATIYGGAADTGSRLAHPARFQAPLCLKCESMRANSFLKTVKCDDPSSPAKQYCSLRLDLLVHQPRCPCFSQSLSSIFSSTDHRCSLRRTFPPGLWLECTSRWLDLCLKGLNGSRMDQCLDET